MKPSTRKFGVKFSSMGSPSFEVVFTGARLDSCAGDRKERTLRQKLPDDSSPPAPVASRIAIYFCREAALARSKFATVAQAMSTIGATIPIKTTSGFWKVCRRTVHPVPPGLNRPRPDKRPPPPARCAL